MNLTLRILPFIFPTLTFCLFAVPPAYAQNSVTIDQLGPGSVEIRQDGPSNSADVHQYRGKDPAPLPTDNAARNGPLGSPNNPNYTDYQKSILDNPYTSSAARAEALTNQPDATTINQNDAAKRSYSDIKDANKIHLQQKGGHNSAKTSQQGKNNDLYIEQTGNNNDVTRKQIGDNNRSRIITNGVVTEDQH